MGSLVLLSGGMDSAVALAQAINEDRRVEAVFIDYGQRHYVEYSSAVDLANFYRIAMTRIDMTRVFDGFGSALTDASRGNLHTLEPKAMAVPNRNLVLLTTALGLGKSRGLDRVVVGVHGGDHEAFPDCRPSFIDSLESSVAWPMGSSIHAPFVNSTKARIALAGHELGVPFELTWSCYTGTAPAHCGSCSACMGRKEAFRKAHVPDPTTYVEK